MSSRTTPPCRRFGTLQASPAWRQSTGRRNDWLSRVKQPLPPAPSPKRRGGAERLTPPLRFGEGVGGRGSSATPPLRFGEGAGGRGSSAAPPLRFGEGAGGRGRSRRLRL